MFCCVALAALSSGWSCLIGAAAFFHDIFTPSDSSSQSKIKIWMPPWVIQSEMHNIINAAYQVILPTKDTSSGIDTGIRTTVAL
jgi:hypothetical protein